MCTITELYQRPVTKGNLASLSPDTAFTLSTKRPALLEWPTDFPHNLPPKPRAKKDEVPKPTPAELETCDHAALDQLNLVDSPLDKIAIAEGVILTGKGNPGFDLVYFEETNGMQPLLSSLLIVTNLCL